MRPRRSSRGSGEQLIWDRGAGTLQATAAAPAAGAQIFTPQAFQVVDVDERLTLRRMRLTLDTLMVTTVGGGTAFAMCLYFGVYLADATAPTVSPDLNGNPVGQRTDWLSLWSDFATVAVVIPGTTVSVNTGQRPPQQYADIKAQRRVDATQALILSIGAVALVGTPPGTFTVTTRFQFSNLYQKSRRQ